MRFQDRPEAGRQLVQQLRHVDLVDPVVLALPRGGVPVAFEVAMALHAPLDVYVARKIGAPGHPEFGIGAIAEGGEIVANEAAVTALGVSREQFDRLVEVESRELERRIDHYRRGRQLPNLRARDVVLVDDGLATGVTAEAAMRAIRHHEPRRVILAVPACAPDTVARLSRIADEVVCVIAPDHFTAVGEWYVRFGQTSDDEVLDLLDRAAVSSTSRTATGPRPVSMAAGGVTLDGDLTMPARATGLVVFAHGSGSGRHSPRNRMVAAALRERGFATLLLDLLTPAEEQLDQRSGHLRFDIDLLAGRLSGATAWASGQEETRSLPVGYFGASTGAGAALLAAGRHPEQVTAIVSRGGRPDLAAPHLGDVRAPTLLVVGGLDTAVIEFNRQAMAEMHAECRLEIVPGATHLFEEAGTLERVAELAGDWFQRHLAAHPDRTAAPRVSARSGR
jgi:putative phosphoribosyl transferase